MSTITLVEVDEEEQEGLDEIIARGVLSASGQECDREALELLSGMRKEDASALLSSKTKGEESPLKDAGTIALHDLFEEHGTDKARNGYAPMYERILSPRRREPFRLLEIGIGTLEEHAFSTMVGFHGPGYRPGGSLRAFRDYLPHATLLGLDVQQDTQFSEPRIETGICDSTNAISVAEFFAWRRDESFDLIIDDGGHRPDMQMATLVNFHSRVAPGGHYVIEDINGEDSYVFHYWEAIVGWRFRMVERLKNALVLERVRG